MSTPSRRELLAALTASGLAGACKNPVTDEPFVADVRPVTADAPWPGVADAGGTVQHLAAGDPTPSSLVLVGVMAPGATAAVHTSVWDGAWQDRAPVSVTADDAGYVRTELSDLPAGAPVGVQLVADDGASHVINGRMPPAPGAALQLDLVVGSCSHQEHGDFPSLSHAMARGAPDLYVGLGDTVYQDTSDSPEAFRALWLDNLNTPAYRTLFQQTFTAFTWDDHEVANNFQGGDDPRVDEGRDRMREVLPLRIDGGAPERIWRTLRYGTTAELFIMDMRSERDQDVGQFISDDQLDWLVRGITESEATWKVVIAPVPISRVFGLLEADIARDDTWKGNDYNEQRLGFLQAINGTPGVLVITGDHHLPAVTQVSDEGPGADLWEIWTGPLGSFRAPAYLLLPVSDQVLWRAPEWTTTRLSFLPSGLVEVQFVGESDETLFQGAFDDRGTVVDWEGVPQPE